MTGGAIGANLVVDWGGAINVAGGSIDDRIQMTAGSELHRLGSHFLLDDTELTADRTPYEPFVVDIRNMAIEGLLVDGSSFDFFLSTSTFGQSYFS